MDISVVIATHNRKDSLRRCLAAVVNQDYDDFEVIVVDDGSTDGTWQMVDQEFSQVLCICQQPKRGPAFARNRGIRAASGDIIAFTDDDCVPPRSWLNSLAAGFLKHPELAGVSGFQEPPTELVQSNTIAMADQIMRRQRWGEWAMKEQFGGYEVPGFATNNVAYQRGVLLEVEGFDESFPAAAGEDADLKLRIVQNGGKLLYVPLQVDHYRPYTWRGQWDMYRRRGIGAYYFENRHGARPGIGRISLRLGKRMLQFLPSLVLLPWRVAVVIFISRIADVMGQYQACWQHNTKN
jgi:glycosyltransferase involved in cell wall biosynthesis